MVATLIAGLACAVAPVHGQDADPLHSPECDMAQRVLEQALEDASMHAEGATQRLAAARKDAIGKCLGRESGRAVRCGAPEPVIVVPPPTIETRPRAVAAPRPPPTPPGALEIPRPVTITTCDPAGCWDSEGRRLNNMGPLIVGPRGLCTLQGGVAQCP